MKLKNKIHLYTTGLFLVLLILIASAVYFSFSRMIYDSELKQSAAETKNIVEGVSQRQQGVPAGDLLRAYVPIDGMVEIVTNDGKVDAAAAAPGHQDLVEFPVTFYQEEKREIIVIDGIPHLFLSVPLIWKKGEVAAIQVIKSLETTEQNLHILRLVLVIVSLLAMIPLFISARVLSDFITRRISAMTSTMKEIQESGQFKRLNLPKESKDELYQMGRTFNKMIDLLEENYKKQEQFVANASHELKTPLTVIESYSSLLKRRGKTEPELFDESVEAIHSEAVRMRELTQQLLELAKKGEHWEIKIENIDIDSFLENIKDTFEKAYHRKIDVHIEHNLMIPSDAAKLKQLLYIFMDNARKYSEDTITIISKARDGQAEIQVIDRGIGISSDELAKVFDRFYRVDKARARKTGGFGLGLSLAKELADTIGADIYLESKEGIGTTAFIVLPLSQ